MKKTLPFLLLLITACNTTSSSDNEKKQKDLNDLIIKEKDEELTKITNEKNGIQRDFDLILETRDSILGTSSALASALAKRNDAFTRKKQEIRAILVKRYATPVELARAKELVGQLNDMIR